MSDPNRHDEPEDDEGRSRSATEHGEDSRATDLDAEEYGSLTIEDEGAETVNPADVAGTASEADADVGYSPIAGEDGAD